MNSLIYISIERERLKYTDRYNYKFTVFMFIVFDSWKYYLYIYIYIGRGEVSVAKVLDCDIVVSEFELVSHYYINFQTNTHGKGMNPLIP